MSKLNINCPRCGDLFCDCVDYQEQREEFAALRDRVYGSGDSSSIPLEEGVGVVVAQIGPQGRTLHLQEMIGEFNKFLLNYSVHGLWYSCFEADPGYSKADTAPCVGDIQRGTYGVGCHYIAGNRSPGHQAQRVRRTK